MSVNGSNVPNYVQSEGNAKFRVNFKPREAAPHNLSVRFNGEPVPGKMLSYYFFVLTLLLYPPHPKKIIDTYLIKINN